MATTAGGVSFRDEIERARSYSVSQQRQAAYAASPANNAELATRTAAIGRAHPHLDAKVVGAAALGGLNPDDPSLMALSARSMEKQKKSSGFLEKFGGVVTAPLRQAMRIAKPVADPIGHFAKAGIRGAMVGLETPFQVAGGMLRNVASLPGVGQLGEIAAGAVAGAAAGAAGGSLFGGIGAIPGAIGGAVVGGIGGGLADPVEGEWQNPFAQSSGGQVISKWAHGDNVDLGSGYFAGGQVQKDMLDRQKKAAMIDGHALTGGRLVADGFFTPGTSAYNIMSGMMDFAAVAKFDPANLIGKEVKLARARRASILGKDAEHLASPTMKFLRGGTKVTQEAEDAAGLVKAEAKLLDTKAAREFLGSDRMKEVIGDIAAEKSPTRIRDLTGGKIRMDLATSLADADNEADVLSHLESAIMRREITEKAALDQGRGLMGTMRTFRKNSRLTDWVMSNTLDPLAAKTERARGNLPLGGIDLIDMDKAPEKLSRAVDYFDDYMKQAGFAKAERVEWTDKLARVDNVADGHKVVEKWVITELDSKLKEMNWDSATRDKVLGSYSKAKAEWQEAIQEEFTSDGRLFSVVLDGDELPIAKGNIVSEYLDNVIQLPDVREVRRRTAGALNLDPRRNPALKKAAQLEADGYFDEAAELRAKYENPKEMTMTVMGKELTASRKALYNNPVWRGSIAAADHMMSKAWRPLTLLRPAWTVRIIGEEQARMIAQGLDAPIAHPFSLIVSMLTKKAPGDTIDATGNLLSRSMQHQEAMAHSQTMGKEANLLSKHRKLYKAADEGFGNAWAGKLLMMNKDDIARRIARDGVQETAAWIKTAEAAATRQRIHSVLGAPGILDNAAAQEQHVYKVYQDLLDVTANDPEIMRAVATGRLKGFKTTKVVPGEAFPVHAETEAMIGQKMVIPESQVRTMEKTLPPGYKLETRRVKVKETLKEGKAPPKKPHVEVRVVRDTPETQRVTKEGLSALTPQEQAKKVAERKVELKRMKRAAKFSGDRTHVPFDLDDIERQLGDLDARGYEALLDEEGGILLTRMDGRGIINPDAATELTRRGLDPAIKTPTEVVGATEISPKHLKWMDRATEYMFQHLLSMPTDYMSRSPAFKQIYWRRMADNAGGMTAEAKSVMMKNAERAGLDRKSLAYVKQATLKSGVGDLDLEDADLLAKAFSVDRIRVIFDDMTKKGAFGDAARHIAPFGNAWKQATMQWARIFVEDPTALRKVQLGIQGPRGIDPDANGQGFFYKDDRGEWVFNYPGSELVNKYAPKLIPGGASEGVPFAFQGSAAGMSMLTSNVLPGFGPMVSIAANRILSDTPQNDDLLQLFSPYGDPTEQGAWAALTPPWFKKIQQAMSDPEVNRLHGDTVADVMRYLVSTGKYETDTPEGQEKLYDDAKARAKALTLLRAGAQATGPAAPKIVPMAQDKNGDTVVAQILMRDLANMQKDDYNTATEKFLSTYGQNAFMFLQSKTRATNPGVTNLDTDEGLDFVRENPELAELLPNTYGFFAPTSEDPENFNYMAYLRLLKTGERESLSPKEQIALANDKVGAMIYYNFKDSLPNKLTREQQSALKDLKGWLQTKYPGFGTAQAGLSERAETPALMQELQNSLEIPKTANTPVGKSLAMYFQIRDQVQAAAESRGLTTWTSAKGASDLRMIMRDLGTFLGKKTPGFNLVYDRVLENEMKNDDKEEEALPNVLTG